MDLPGTRLPVALAALTSPGTPIWPEVGFLIWGIPKIRGPFLVVLRTRAPTILGSILGPLIFEISHMYFKTVCGNICNRLGARGLLNEQRTLGPLRGVCMCVFHR